MGIKENKMRYGTKKIKKPVKKPTKNK